MLWPRAWFTFSTVVAFFSSVARRTIVGRVKEMRVVRVLRRVWIPIDVNAYTHWLVKVA
jgi:hypothetical protein